jgi:hypothetical protein
VVRRSDKPLFGTAVEIMPIMHADGSARGLRETVQAAVSQGVLTKDWLDKLDQITMVNIWRPLLVKHKGVEHRFNQGTDLTGVLTFSLRPDWFTDLRGSEVSVQGFVRLALAR